MAFVMDNRLELLQCACELFAERGYDAIGVQEIVDRSGVTKPTLYHYFGSKEGLLTNLASFYLQPFLDLLKEKAEYKGDILNVLREVTSTYFEFVQKEPVFFQFWICARIAPPKSDVFRVFARYINEEYAIINGLFQKAANQHGNLRGRQHAYTVSFLGTTYTYATLGLRGEQEMNQQLVHSAVQQFLYGIFS